MTTKSQEKQDEATKHILKAHNALCCALHPDTDGFGGWSDVSHNEMFEAMTELYKMYKKLTR